MKRILMSLVAVSTMAMLGSGCVSLDEYNRTAEHLQTEQEANRAMAAENARLEGEVTKAQTDREKLLATIESLKEQASKTPEIDEESIVERFKEIWGSGLGGNDNWEYVFQSDLVSNDDFIGDNDSVWGINQYLFYTLNDCAAVGTRVEWWKNDGVSYNAATFGLNYRPHANLVFRPEIKHEWVPGLDLDQTIFGIDMIVTY